MKKCPKCGGKVSCLGSHGSPEPDGLFKIKELYEELIMAVASKYQGETRHETALKYINQAEEGRSRPAKQEKDEAGVSTHNVTHWEPITPPNEEE